MWICKKAARAAAVFVCFAATGAGCSMSVRPPAPSLDNNPSYDVIVTTRRPLLTISNPDGGGRFRYDIELDTSPDFDSPRRVDYRGVEPVDRWITSRRVEPGDALRDKTRYWWRARSTDARGSTSPWVRSRFMVNTAADDAAMGLVRIAVQDVAVSSGAAAAYITDINDFAPGTYWQSTPPGDAHQWVRLDLGAPRRITRLWLLSNPKAENGRLVRFDWQVSLDGKDWRPIPGAGVERNDTFRNTIDFEPVTGRYVRLSIAEWKGYAAQVNSIRLYGPGRPAVPAPPKGDYVLVVGNQQDGGTFTELARRIRSFDLGLQTLTVPYHEVSMDMLAALDPQPVAVVLSGSLASYSQIPMFEYNGEYEIIRNARLPVLGICCGHQQLVMAHGFSFVRGMGWEDFSSLEPPDKRTKTRMLAPRDPIFEGVVDPFVGVEVHGWAVGVVPEGYRLIAKSSYVQVIQHPGRLRYGMQFHPEIRRPWNQAAGMLENFLREALRARRSESRAPLRGESS